MIAVRPWLAGTAASMALIAAPAQQAPGGTSTPAPPAAASVESTVSMCVGCHAIPDYQTSFPRVYRVPKIGGQSAAYLASALQAYRRGDRDHPTMKAIAGSLTDQQIAAVADFFSRQGAEP
ncbi:MAG TPA: cytochrome c [Burkholderiaceae bacterium]